jgi:hypothetical protein
MTATQALGWALVHSLWQGTPAVACEPPGGLLLVTYEVGDSLSSAIHSI